MVTAGTLYKQHFFKGQERLRELESLLLDLTAKHQWELRAWAVFSNHYHFIARSPEDLNSLEQLIRELHSKTAKTANQLEQAKGRKVWHEYWDKCLTYEKSYYARL